jgi:hypothetical protein
MSVTPDLARSTWRSTEAIHGMIYFTPDAAESYARVGVTHPRAGYFASRVAAMGPASAEVTIATFYNFNPALVRRHVPAVWDTTSPSAMLTARLDAADTSLRRAFGSEVLASAELAELSELAREAALVACESPEGRPLFAAHAALPWPDDPHLVLWHAQTLLREYRGDGHLAQLLSEGLSGLEALVSHAASGDVPAGVLRLTRAWSEAQWEAAVVALAERGLVEPTEGGNVGFTDDGRAQRERIERGTDRLAATPFAALGTSRCERWKELGKPLSRCVVDAGLLVVDPKRFED